MKILIIGGNRFVGLRLAKTLENQGHDLHILNRTGQSPHLHSAVIYKGDRANLHLSHLDKDWDAIIDFAAYSEADVRESMAYFGNVKRYIFISTVSVYDLGANLTESAFRSETWDLSQLPLKEGNTYRDGKRRAEAVFTQSGKWPTVSVRFPVILGPDDYTGRLEFHTERISENKPIYISRRENRISMIHAQDACEFLNWSLTQKFTGPVNVASPSPIQLGDLIYQIERKSGHKAILLDKDPGGLRSPYDPTNDYYVNTDLAKSLGFEARPILTWLPELIEQTLDMESSASSRLH